ncbi:hypothetical protein G195_011259 [Phytophthora kernoviae 00238/432]|uniref:RxLR effector protein n=1 Tax=Phytophthora kernoviae 00238/432 TaxID=1284355 RepID=A0A8J4RQR0_9STRA|nr:hypothetical protein G195_011259 [Phytophthora kernoviae 00238/432]
MKVLSTLALLVVTVQYALAASPERKLLRSGYDSPIDFSTLTGGKSDSTQQTGDSTTSGGGLPGIDSITKTITGGRGGLSNMLPSGLPSTDSLTSLTKGGGLSSLTDALPIGGGSGLGSITKGLTGGGKNVLPTDLTALTGKTRLTDALPIGGGSGLGSITKGLTGGGKLPVPGLDSLPIGGGGGGGKGLASITDGVSGLTDGLGLPSTSGGKKSYASSSDTKSGVKSGEEVATPCPTETTTKLEAEKSPDQKPAIVMASVFLYCGLIKYMMKK